VPPIHPSPAVRLILPATVRLADRTRSQPEPTASIAPSRLPSVSGVVSIHDFRKNPFQSSTGGEVEHAGHRSAAFRPARIAKQTVADPTTVGGETPRERAPVERMTLPRFDAVRRPENVQAADLDTRRCY